MQQHIVRLVSAFFGSFVQNKTKDLQIMKIRHTASPYILVYRTKLCISPIQTSAAKPDPFFRVEPNFGPKIRVESGRVGPQGQKTGPIGSSWSQKGFKFGFNPIMYLINPNEPDLNPISGRVGAPGSKFGLSRVGLGPQGPNSG